MPTVKRARRSRVPDAGPRRWKGFYDAAGKIVVGDEYDSNKDGPSGADYIFAHYDENRQISA
jgi:hypothetical protein